MGVRHLNLLPLAIGQKVLAKLLSCLGAAEPGTGPQLPLLLQWPFQSLKEEGLGVCRLPKKMRWKELFECDRPPCSSRGFVQISQNPFACCSKTPCSSRGFGGPCSFRRFGGDFWKVFATLFWHGELQSAGVGCLPGAKSSQTVKQLPTKHRTPTPIPPNRQQRAHQAKRVGHVRGGVRLLGGKYCCSLQQKDQISSAENTSARQMGRLWHCSTVRQRRTELYTTEALRGLTSGHEIQTKPIRKVNVICGRRSF